MASISVPVDKLNKVLMDVEVLIGDVALLINQDETAKKRLLDVKNDPSKSVSEEELNSYLKKRGVEIE
ncbi:hypothetical protein J4205_00875 [Candidatus Pacearchaeota archaeon]|nr:hypothetical protein [Candidatus Pacearchaeota archaeon]